MPQYPSHTLNAKTIEELAALRQEQFKPEWDDVAGRNTRRAYWASSALVAYSRNSGNASDSLAILTDLMADLLHLADALELEADVVAESALDQYKSDRAGSGY